MEASTDPDPLGVGLWESVAAIVMVATYVGALSTKKPTPAKNPTAPHTRIRYFFPRMSANRSETDKSPSLSTVLMGEIPNRPLLGE
jgi:hypothetical protein